ncbi:glycosyltransferase family 2 protein [Bacillus salipaludis]|uniref:Glycosyltransferase family 2 protein n=1 Tax=Bacillus salipaludis TaxID=2547811 RepID=A0A4R5VU69_9BACI|nr:glycosyltransferase family 2 protein [Bacillus salipaludis]TDK62173.1 glycosyltransferase family 2 protein [Bacillus salipaludis]
MNQPYISVILPIYNVEQYIREAFETLLNQTIGFEHLEIIMVNDCSTDGTIKILNEYAHKYTNVKIINLPVNSGAPGTPRNEGMKEVNGKYTIFLDPDDLLPVDAYEKLYKVAEKWDSDFVMGTMESFKDSDPKRKTWFHMTFRDYLMKKSYYNVSIKEVPFFLQVKTAVYLKLVKSNFIKKHGLRFVEGMKNGEDKYYDMQLFTLAKKFSYIPETIYLYRTRDDENNLSMTQQDMESTILNDCKAAEIVKPLLSDKQYEVFQINALRSLFWKLIDPAFNALPYDKRRYLLERISKVVSSYNEELIQKYFKLELPIVSLLSKGYIDLAMEYTQMHISRKFWYVQGNNLLKQYKRQTAFLNSKSWRITRPLRILNEKRRKFKKQFKMKFSQ